MELEPLPEVAQNPARNPAEVPCIGDDLDQVQLLVEEQPDLVMPVSGELISLQNPSEVAQGLDYIRGLIGQLGDLRRVLETVLRLEAARQGTKTLHVAGWTATVSGGEKVEWDIDLLRDGLRAAGLPEEQLSKLVAEEITYKVDGRVARSMASANALYAAAILKAKQAGPGLWRVTVKPTR